MLYCSESLLTQPYELICKHNEQWDINQSKWECSVIAQTHQLMYVASLEVNSVYSIYGKQCCCVTHLTQCTHWSCYKFTNLWTPSEPYQRILNSYLFCWILFFYLSFSFYCCFVRQHQFTLSVIFIFISRVELWRLFFFFFFPLSFFVCICVGSPYFCSFSEIQYQALKSFITYSTQLCKHNNLTVFFFRVVSCPTHHMLDLKHIRNINAFTCQLKTFENGFNVVL